MLITLDAIEKLAPDAASLKAAQGLLNPKNWQQSAWHQREGGEALSGLCAGSGKNPYQVLVDLRGEVAFKCSCPSRKFPCKHGLALLLRHCKSALPAADVPDWGAEWLVKRDQKAAAPEAQTAPPKAKKAVSLTPKRLENAREGAALLLRWLDDVMRGGLMHFDDAQAFEMAKRLVDAQLGGLANQLLTVVDGWLAHGRINELHQWLSALYALASLLQRRETLSPEWRDEVDYRVGFPVNKDEILAQTGVVDVWHCVGIESRELERGKEVFYWLYGASSKRFAYLMEFEIAGKVSVAPALLGGAYAGALCFYRGVHALRALSQTWEFLGFQAPTGVSDLQHAWRKMQSALAENPLIERYPLIASPMQWALHDTHYIQCFDESALLPTQLRIQEHIGLLAESLNQPFGAFFMYDTVTQNAHLLHTWSSQ